MGHVRLKDGTSIASDRVGNGRALILSFGATDDGAENSQLAPELAQHFTLYNSPGAAGESGDTAPYTVEREIKDLEALVTEAGGSAHVFGVSSGGALALEATAAGPPINQLVVWEVPYDMSEDAPQRHKE